MCLSTFSTGDPALDDVLDWYAVERQEGISFLTEWQERYPVYAEDLAQFEAFLKLSGFHDSAEVVPIKKVG